MIEMKNGKKILTTPISAEDLADIHIGDIIYLNGSLTTCRDVAHRRLVEGHRELPVDVRNAAIFHAGPIIRPLENGKFEMVSVGPTTSMRMEKFEKEFVEQTGVRVIVGKGGLQKFQSTSLCIPGWKCCCSRNRGGGNRRCPVAGSRYAGNAVALPCQRIWSSDCIDRYGGTEFV